MTETQDVRRPLSVRDFVSEGSAFSTEHLLLRESVRQFLEERLPTEALVQRAEAAELFDRGIWRDLAAQIGAQGLAVPERLGGSGYGWTEQGIIFHELGRVLYAGPYLATVSLAMPALLASEDDDAQAAWLPGLVSGELAATVLVPTRHGQEFCTADVTTAAVSVTGSVSPVLAGSQADLLIVPAIEQGQLSLFLVEADTDGVTRERLVSLDLARDYSTVDLRDAPAIRMGAIGAGTAILELLHDRVVLCQAAEQLGATEACLEMAVDYAKIREQFDRPIGSFQAIKHTCSKMLLAQESARALTEHAAWIADNRPELLPAAAAACGATCSETLASVAYDAVHIHGGLGFTWEHRAHLYYRRAKADAILFGTPDEHRANLAAWICDDGA
jgi:alkylation response protein AidB-like acyl-CoA dehydrogenase